MPPLELAPAAIFCYDYAGRQHEYADMERPSWAPSTVTGYFFLGFTGFYRVLPSFTESNVVDGMDWASLPFTIKGARLDLKAR